VCSLLTDEKVRIVHTAYIHM